MVRSDPPLHTQLRQAINRAFSPRAVASLRPFIVATVDSLLAEAPPGEPFEVMGGLAEPLPVAPDALSTPPAPRGEEL